MRLGQLWNRILSHQRSAGRILDELEVELAVRDYAHRKLKGLPENPSRGNLSVVIFWGVIVLLGCVLWYLLRSH
jgi:hypothetical protein